MTQIKIPDRVYLQFGDLTMDENVANRLHEIAAAPWCAERLNESDTEYVRADLSRAADTADVARKDELERCARALCEWCGNEEYDLIFHHGEWRHYRKRDMHVEYCGAAAIRAAQPESKQESRLSDE